MTGYEQKESINFLCGYVGTDHAEVACNRTGCNGGENYCIEPLGM